MITACVIVLFAHAQQPVTVIVKNVKTQTGNIRVGIFKDEKSFLKEAFIGKVVKAEKGEITVVFDNIPAGKYGLSVIHDENENGELDSNMIGIPKEGFGFGNDAMGTFGPPDFEKASVDVRKDNASFSVSLRYM